MAPKRSRVWARRILVAFAILGMLASASVVYAWRHFEGNINTVDFLDGRASNLDGPQNVLVMGSDSRAGTKIGGSTPGLSDTTILMHLSEDRSFAYGVSLPRDSMLVRPPCPRKNGDGVDPGGLAQFNAAYAIGGPACTVKTVEAATGIRIDHFVVIDFVGFKDMVDAIDGVTICVPEEVNDTIGNIHLPEGTYKVTGRQALDYVRVRHGLGAELGDIGRMKRQQTFIAAMVKKVVSAGTLANPTRLLGFLDAATRSLTTDPGLADLRDLASVGYSLKSIGLDNVKFITVPWQPWSQDPNRVEWKPEAEQLWRLFKQDLPLRDRFTEDAISAGGEPTPGPGGSPTAGPSDDPTADPTPGGSTTGDEGTEDEETAAEREERRKREAAFYGLCA